MQIAFSSVPNNKMKVKFSELKKFLGDAQKGFGAQQAKITNHKARAVSNYCKQYDNVELQFIEPSSETNTTSFCSTKASKKDLSLEFHAIVPKYKAHLQEFSQIDSQQNDKTPKVEMDYKKMLVRTREMEQKFSSYLEQKNQKYPLLEATVSSRKNQAIVEGKDCKVIYNKVKSSSFKGSSRQALKQPQMPGPSDYLIDRLFEDTQHQPKTAKEKHEQQRLENELFKARKELGKYIEQKEPPAPINENKQQMIDSEVEEKGTSSFAYKNDRFGRPEFPYVLRMPEPGPGKYKDDQLTMQTKLEKQNQKLEQQKVVKEWFQKFKSG